MRSGVTVREARPEDWSAMQDIFKEAGKKAWDQILSADALEQIVASERWHESIYSVAQDTTAFVAEMQNRVIGFAVVRPTADTDALPATGEIDAFYTHPKIWGVGAGQSLMEASLKRLKEAGMVRATLWTEERNHRPRRFYELSGWRAESTVRHREVFGADITEVRYWILL